MRKYFLIAVAIFILDRLLKILSVNLMDKIFLIPKFVSFDRHINYGIVFSLDFPLWPVMVLSVIFMAAILYFLMRSYFSYLSSPNVGEARRGFGWLLLILGALGNFLDRIIYRGTVDYVNILDVSLINLADGMILGGIIILIWIFKSEARSQKIN